MIDPQGSILCVGVYYAVVVAVSLVLACVCSLAVQHYASPRWKQYCDVY